MPKNISYNWEKESKFSFIPYNQYEFLMINADWERFAYDLTLFRY